jgi:hypothetical protein
VIWFCPHGERGVSDDIAERALRHGLLHHDVHSVLSLLPVHYPIARH